MKRITKIITAVVMMAAIAVTTFVPVNVQAAPYFKEKMTLYKSSNKNSYQESTDFYIGDLGKSDTIKKSSIKSSNAKVLNFLEMKRTKTSYETESLLSSYSSPSKYDTYQYNIEFRINKPGKTNLTFKIGNKSYKSVITVKKYENPLKTAKMFGKNYASKIKDGYFADITTKSTQKNQKFTFEANTNWKITSVSFKRYDTNDGYYSSDHVQEWYYFNTPKKKVSCDVGTIEKKGAHYYSVEVCLTNTKTGGTLKVWYEINSPWA